MNLDELEILFFNKNDKEFGKFDKIKNKLSRYSDLHAFLFLSQFKSNKLDEEDFIYELSDPHNPTLVFNVDLEDFCKKVTEENVTDLVRCKVFIGESGLEMPILYSWENEQKKKRMKKQEVSKS
jgi:hypothetical protein